MNKNLNQKVKNIKKEITPNNRVIKTNNKTSIKTILILSAIFYILFLIVYKSPLVAMVLNPAMREEDLVITNTSVKIMSGFFLLMIMVLPIIHLLQPYILEKEKVTLTKYETIISIALLVIDAIVIWCFKTELFYFVLCIAAIYAVNIIFSFLLGKDVYSTVLFIRTFFIFMLNLLILCIVLNISTDGPYGFYALLFSLIMMYLYKIILNKVFKKDAFADFAYTFIAVFMFFMLGLYASKCLTLNLHNYLYDKIIFRILPYCDFEQIVILFITFGYSLFSYFIVNVIFNKKSDEDKYIKRGNLIINFALLISTLILISVIDVDILIKMIFIDITPEIKQWFIALLDKIEFSLSILALIIAFKDIRDKKV